MVSLYDQGDKIVVDADEQRLRKLLGLGVNKAPVVFYFNREHQRPVSEFKADAELKDIMDAFYGKGLRLTPPPQSTVAQSELAILNSLVSDATNFLME